VPYEPENDPEINQSKVSILEGQMPKKLGFGDGDKSGIIKKPLDVDKSKKNLKTQYNSLPERGLSDLPAQTFYHRYQRAFR
jgi:hypothetical protein